ncbi:MAG: hypothetical protein OR995_08145 [Candidatus Nanopelagicales bacterium]|nr:hypothetical protein [Candidatus Nanopelagicales bacterium]
MKKAVLMVPLVTSLFLFGAATAPAQASFKDDLINAATNMIERSDVPKVLGPLPEDAGWSFDQPSPRAQVCEVPNEKGKNVLITGKYSQQSIGGLSLKTFSGLIQNVM